MKVKELREKNDSQLNKLLSVNREKLRDLRFKVSLGQLKTVREIRQIRKLIAQVLTLLKRRSEGDQKVETQEKVIQEEKPSTVEAAPASSISKEVEAKS